MPPHWQAATLATSESACLSTGFTRKPNRIGRRLISKVAVLIVIFHSPLARQLALNRPQNTGILDPPTLEDRRWSHSLGVKPSNLCQICVGLSLLVHALRLALHPSLTAVLVSNSASSFCPSAFGTAAAHLSSSAAAILSAKMLRQVSNGGSGECCRAERLPLERQQRAGEAISEPAAYSLQNARFVKNRPRQHP